MLIWLANTLILGDKPKLHSSVCLPAEAIVVVGFVRQLLPVQRARKEVQVTTDYRRYVALGRKKGPFMPLDVKKRDFWHYADPAASHAKSSDESISYHNIDDSTANKKKPLLLCFLIGLRLTI